MNDTEMVCCSINVQHNDPMLIIPVVELKSATLESQFAR